MQKRWAAVRSVLRISHRKEIHVRRIIVVNDEENSEQAIAEAFGVKSTPVAISVASNFGSHLSSVFPRVFIF